MPRAQYRQDKVLYEAIGFANLRGAFKNPQLTNPSNNLNQQYDNHILSKLQLCNKR